MNNNSINLSALAMDLKRASLGYHRGSLKMGLRFLQEALKRKDQIERAKVKPYINQLLDRLDDLFIEKDHQKVAEDTLMYSTLFQNAALASK